MCNTFGLYPSGHTHTTPRVRQGVGGRSFENCRFQAEASRVHKFWLRDLMMNHLADTFQRMEYVCRYLRAGVFRVALLQSPGGNYIKAFDHHGVWQQ